MNQGGYLTYMPGATSGKPTSYTGFLDHLGFKPEADTIEKRTEFLHYFRTHVDYSDNKFLRRSDNGPALRTVVIEFLNEFGPVYWGLTNREHLEEMDPLKGYLHPRDTMRPNSRLIDALEETFDYKAKNAVSSQTKVHGPDWPNKHVDYANLTGRKIGAPMKALVEATRPRERRPVPGDDSGEESDKSDPHWNIFDEVETETWLRPLGGNARWIRRVSRPTNAAAAHDDPKTPIRSAKKGKKISGTVSSTDSDVPLRSVRRRSTTFYRSITPAVQISASAPSRRKRRQSSIVSSQSSLNDILSKKKHTKTQRSKAKENPKTAIPKITSSDNRKVLLPAEFACKTYFTVAAENMPERGPVRVPFTSCSTAKALFPTMIRERKIRPVLQDKISDMTATLPETNERICIRKESPQDWVIFCNLLRKLWEQHSDRLGNECRVAVLMHIDEE